MALGGLVIREACSYFGVIIPPTTIPDKQLSVCWQSIKRLERCNASSISSAKSRKTRKWLKVIEFAVVGIATWLNPSAGFLIFLLKLCFQILALLQDERER